MSGGVSGTTAARLPFPPRARKARGGNGAVRHTVAPKSARPALPTSSGASTNSPSEEGRHPTKAGPRNLTRVCWRSRARRWLCNPPCIAANGKRALLMNEGALEAGSDGLRERNKRDKLSRIRAAALELFVSKGCRRVSPR